MVGLHSFREAESAQGPPSATERRECKSRVTLLLRDADSGQIDHMAAEPTHPDLTQIGLTTPMQQLKLAALGARGRVWHSQKTSRRSLYGA